MEALADVGVASDRSVSLPGMVASTETGMRVCGLRETYRHALIGNVQFPIWPRARHRKSTSVCAVLVELVPFYCANVAGVLRRWWKPWVHDFRSPCRCAMCARAFWHLQKVPSHQTAFECFVTGSAG